MTNRELVQKADLALSDLTSNGGILPDEEALAFVKKVTLAPTILNTARKIGMKSHTKKINKIGFGSRILHKGVSGTATSSGDRVKPTTSQLEMVAKEVKATIYLPYDVIEDNIESAPAANNETSNSGPGGIRALVLGMIAEQAAIDIEELALLGDTASGTNYYTTTDGWLKLAEADGNVVDYGNAAVSKSLFKQGKLGLPVKYLRDLATMRHFVSSTQETEYRDTLADRATALGDQMIQGTAPLYAYGAQINACFQMPDAKGLFTNPLNLLFGVWREIRLEFDKDIEVGVYKIVLTARIALQIEEAEAIVLYNNIGT